MAKKIEFEATMDIQDAQSKIAMLERRAIESQKRIADAQM